MGSFPLIGPHGDYEADLLLYSRKPVCLLVDKHPPSGVEEEFSPILERIRNDIKRLNCLVEKDQLIFREYEHVRRDGEIQRWNFFSKPAHEKSLGELYELIVSHLENRPPILEGLKPQWEYFGYTEADAALFEKGGYDSLPFPFNAALKHTHQFRVRCRANSDIFKQGNETQLSSISAPSKLGR